MYEKHFGLSRRPFSGGISSADVFVGPQTAAAIAGLKKALARPDAVVAVSGPAGVGKTMVVAKALEALGPSYKLIRIGRMHLDDSDVMEYFLQTLGVAKPPNGAVRRFAAFRKLLEAMQAQNMRVVVVVEDAVRTGLDTLAELEAVTAADAGPAAGTNIILMGNDGLGTLLKDPQLERMVQRTRHRQKIEPMNAAEMRGYLRHTFRQAGGDFEKIFDKDAVNRISRLSGGIPRVANNLVEAALVAAAGNDDNEVSARLVAKVASEELGLDLAERPAPADESALIVESGVVTGTLKAIEPVPEPAPDPEPEIEAEPVAASSPVAEREPEPVIVFSDEPMQEEPPLEDDEIPELIQDTLPDLAILAPEVVAAAEPVADEDEVLPTLEAEPEPLPEPAPEPEPEVEAEVEAEPEALPELEPLAEVTEESKPAPEPAPEPLAEVAAESKADDVPEWERDPTLAQLKPDLDALEKAMAFEAEDDVEEVEVEVEVAAKPAPVTKEPEEIPEITLDNAIQQRIDNNLIDEPGQISPSATEAGSASAKSDDLPEIRLAPAKSKKADAELERIASELARAKTIEDVDDKMAETLFGEEINLIASQVVASGSSAESANDGEVSLFDTTAAQQAQAAGTPAGQVAGSVDVSLETPERNGEGGLDLEASQRLKTVRALNTDLHPSLREPDNAAEAEPSRPARNVERPAPIEDQINTSMTQTLKALNVRPPVLDQGRPEAYEEDDDVEDEPEERKGGFFSRFRRS